MIEHPYIESLYDFKLRFEARLRALREANAQAPSKEKLPYEFVNRLSRYEEIVRKFRNGKLKAYNEIGYEKEMTYEELYLIIDICV